MGWRYRKSINLGGGFRINLSKSGIGYSWGFPGYRHTYSPNGTQRKTYSIPGTGISYVESQGKINRNSSNSGNNYNYNQDTKLITGATTYYQNSNINNMGKGDEILKAINKLRTIDILANICLIMVVLFPIGIILKILISQKWKLDLTYEMDDINQKKFDALNEFLVELKNNRKLWQIGSSTIVYNTKYNAGAGNNVSRTSISLVKKMPWYINHNIDVYCLKLKNEKIFFTPDRMLIFKNMGRVGCRKYNDMVAGFSTTNFVEIEMVPRDAEIVEYTWRYVNKSGGPDKRFNNNRRIPVCKYGEISLESEDGINILLECSNHNLMYSIQDKFTEFINYHNKIISSKGYKGEYELEDDDSFEDYAEKEVVREMVQEPVDNNDKWNNFNNDDIEENKNNVIANEVIQEPVIVEPVKESNKVPNSEKDNNNPVEPQSKKSTFPTILCYIQVAFASMMCLGCLLNFNIICALLWGLVVLIFIPKIKNILCKKNEFIRKYIITIRVVLVIIALFSLSTLSNQFEGTWVNDNGERITLDSTYLKYIDSQNKEIESPYSFESVSTSDYDYLYDIKVKYKNEDVVFRYSKKNSTEFLCIYKNNECIENFKKDINE